jgi:hypothetical protein
VTSGTQEYLDSAIWQKSRSSRCGCSAVYLLGAGMWHVGVQVYLNGANVVKVKKQQMRRCGVAVFMS